MSKRFSGLFRDTWWLWVLFLIVSVCFSIFVSRLFLATLPALVVAFVYYASMRYDDDGNAKGES